MAAEIHSRPQTARPVLLNKIEGHSDAVNAAVLIPKEDGVITVSEDRTIRVWLKRDSGQYWPSIYHTVSSPCSCMSYHHDSRRIFIGQDNGAVVEFLISEDFNKMNHVKTYPAHQNRVSDMIFSLESEWVVSTGHDKSVSWMCTQSGSMLGRHYFTAWASCLQYDHETQHAFVGDYSGQITLLKLEKQTYSTITTLKGHEGSVGALWWDPIQRLLFSGASDHSVIMWDIGGRKGRTLLLQGHQQVSVVSVPAVPRHRLCFPLDFSGFIHISPPPSPLHCLRSNLQGTRTMMHVSVNPYPAARSTVIYNQTLNPVLTHSLPQVFLVSVFLFFFFFFSF
ncbi:WD repeat and FYVE domain-containing protein 1 isoform X2 [Mastacembelus armatus]|uniref:WD repeat and FYVE domain-containing protein 1 isoform X2 n=1 Tax=Mastacembelus armatus TaxID=205130 RepID=UPI000E45A1EC|nr:WD repeat and FYVE domain-containing protein 1 isoform X2 [Mastacembelus armatus]